MEYDWQFSQRSECSEPEKHQCMELVSHLIELSMIARRNGLLSLIKVAEQNSHFLLNKGLQLLVDGVSPKIVRTVLENYINLGNYSGKDLLEHCIILEGVIAIQQGLHPKVTKEVLLSFLGERIYNAFQQQYESCGPDSLESYLKRIESTRASSPTGLKLDELILDLDDAGMENFLMAINTGELAKSLKDMGGQAQIKLFNYLSEKAAIGLKEAFEDLDQVDDAELTRIQEMAIEIITDIRNQATNSAIK